MKKITLFLSHYLCFSLTVSAQDDGGDLAVNTCGTSYLCDGTAELGNASWPADCSDGSDEILSYCCANDFPAYVGLAECEPYLDVDDSSDSTDVVDPLPCEGTVLTVDGGLYLNEKSWEISNCDGELLVSGGAPFDECVQLGDNYQINLTDSYGDGWDGTVMTIGDAVYTIDDGASASFVVGSCGVAGCTDEAACNYNADATFDDGSCDVPAEGIDCEGNCISGALLTMNDSWGDGWNGQY